MQAEDHVNERAEWSSHAIYGLIITAALVADREAAEDPLTSLLLLWGAGLVLILAHVYAAIVGEVGAEGQWLSHAERHVLIVDNIPVLAAVVVPSILIVAAGLGLIGRASRSISRSCCPWSPCSPWARTRLTAMVRVSGFSSGSVRSVARSASW